MPPVAITIAASDPLGGAGVQADLATFAARGVHGTSALTTVTAQSLTGAHGGRCGAGRRGRLPDATRWQTPSTSPLPRRGCCAGERWWRWWPSGCSGGVLPPPVVDPVMVDGAGVRFVSDEVEQAYRKRLFPLARVITPNRAEAELLARRQLPDAEAVLACAEEFRSLGAAAVVVTGGAFDSDPDNVVITASDAWVVPGRRIATRNVRGSGCTFSAAVAADLALGADLAQAVQDAARFVRAAIERSASWRLNGPGPVSHSNPQSS